MSDAVDHTLYNCTSCHITHNAPGSGLTNVGGNALLCQSCHTSTGAASAKPLINADNGVSSHAWDVLAVNAAKETNLPSNAQMAVRIVENKIICSTCHNQHNTSQGNPHLRISNTGDALCKECHIARDVGLYSDDNVNHKGSHPVGLTYNGSDPRFQTNPINSNILLPDGKIECSSCHGVHDVTGTLDLATNGNLLRAPNNDNLCTSCHLYEGHNGFSCNTCHQTHNTDKTNIYMIRNSIVTPNSGTKSVLFASQTGTNSFADGDVTYDGICEVCHTMTAHYSNDGSAADQHHTSQGGQDGSNCTTCHPHGDSFAPTGGGCTECHTVAFPNWGVTDSHFAHTSKYSYNCNTCHLNYGSGCSLEPTHPDSTLNPDNTMNTPVAAEVNLDPNGLATRNGLDLDPAAWAPPSPAVYNIGAKTCDNIYCHSTGQTAKRGSDATDNWGGSTSESATYTTTPAWTSAVGTINTCYSCHNAVGNMTAPFTITDPWANTDPPSTGKHTSAAHTGNSQEFNGVIWEPDTQCFWCHNTNNGDVLPTMNQGTYGTSLHVDGTTYFSPLSVVDGGTMLNGTLTSGGSFSYSKLGSDTHCGAGKQCW